MRWDGIQLLSLEAAIGQVMFDKYTKSNQGDINNQECNLQSAVNLHLEKYGTCLSSLCDDNSTF